MIIVRIQYLYQILGKVLLLYCLVVISFVKGIQLKYFYRLCVPDHQRIYHVIVITYDRHIIRYGNYRLIIPLHKLDSAVRLCLCRNIPSKFYFIGILRSAQLERIAVLQPVVRNFHLITVLNFLFEHTVTVTDSTAVCRIA